MLIVCCSSLLANHSFVFNEAVLTHTHLCDIHDILNANPDLKEKFLDLFNMAQVGFCLIFAFSDQYSLKIYNN